MKITNEPELTNHGHRELRRQMVAVVNAGLEALDPARAVRKCVVLDGDELTIDGRAYRLRGDGRVIVLGAGKASLTIASALEEILGDRIDHGLVVARQGQGGTLARVELAHADHPLPGAASFHAGRRLLELAESAGPNDLVLCCFTGGSSALASMPPIGISEEVKSRLHRQLLSSGMPITAVNTVRKHVSSIKGGRLAHAAMPARIVSLTVSDVSTNELDAITDPSVQDTTVVEDAVAALHAYGLWDVVDGAIRAHLGRPQQAESPDLTAAQAQAVLLITGDLGSRAMAHEASNHGFQPVVLSTQLSAEGRELGTILAQIAREACDHSRPFSAPCALVGCGGESTVDLGCDGEFGAGGPNQEASLGAALAIGHGSPIAAAFVDTDGSDGGTAYAGALVDGLTRDRATSASIELRAALREHRALEPLRALGELIVTGPTGTNANDLFVLLVGEGSVEHATDGQ